MATSEEAAAVTHRRTDSGLKTTAVAVGLEKREKREKRSLES